MIVRLARLEPLLVLLAAPPLVFRERYGLPAQLLALAWIAGLWLLRRRATGRWTVRTVLEAPVLALLLTLPGAIYTANRVVVDIGLAAAISRAESLLFAIALAYALANAVDSPRRLWTVVTAFLVAALGLVAVALISVGWLEKYAALTPALAQLPRLIQSVPHATLPTYGVAGAVAVHPNSVAALLILFLPLALACLVWARPQPPAALRAPAPSPNAGVGGKTSGVGGGPVHSDSPSLVPTPVLGEGPAERSEARVGGEALGRPDLDASPDPIPPPPDPDANTPPRWIRPLAAVVLVAGGALLLLTQSRGAWMGLAAALAGMAALRWRPMRGLLAGAGVTAAVLVLAVGPQTVLARLGASGLPGAASGPGRLTLWQEALALLHASPELGIGLNAFVVVHGRRPEYQGAFVYQGAPHAHNVLLQTALDYGLPGFVAVVGLGVALAWAAWRAHRRLAGTPLDAVAIGLAFGLVAHAMHGLVDAVAIGAKIGFVPWALAGALAGLRAGAHRYPSRPYR